MINGIKITLVAAVMSGVIGLTVGWTINGWKMQSQINGMVAKHTEALAKANADALAKYVAMERKKQEALDEANKIAQQNAAAARAVGFERDRLRQQLLTANSRLSTASCPSVRNYTATLSTVFAECVASLESMAAKADGHALDSRTLIKSWVQ